MRSRYPRTRLNVMVLCCVQLSLVPVVLSQSTAPGQKLHNAHDAHLQHIAEPPELAGEPPPKPASPTPASLQFVQSKAISAAKPEDLNTLPPAIREITELIRLEPTNSDFYLLRATLSCYVHANSTEILDDISRSMSLHAQSASSAYSTLRDHHALKAKIEFESGHFDDSMHDLDAAIRENYEDAKEVFNDGNTKPTTTTQPCVWTQADLDKLERRFPQDYRPPMYRGLYLTFFYSFDLDSDYSPVFDAFHRAATLNPASALPEFYIGELYSIGRLGGLMSTKNAECLDWVVPRTPKCLALDEVYRSGVRSLTRAIALGPKFGPAYALRASSFTDLKEYRQAVRDYDRVLQLTSEPEAVRTAHNDRGLAKASLGEYRSAVEDFTKSIAIGCEGLCGSYENRADVYIKLRDYPKAMRTLALRSNRSFPMRCS
jgi:tetratricopeptide (TPR) repeat protein